MFKKLALGIGLLIVVAAVGLFYTWSNLDSIIKSAVEKYGTAATQASVHLGGVKFSLKSGEGALSDFSVANPKGFSDAKALGFGEVSVSVDVNSVRGTGPIVIKQVKILKPQISYEIANDGGSNLQTLTRNAKAYAASLGGASPKSENAARNSEGHDRTIIINDVLISEGKIGMTQATLARASGKAIIADLPTIHLTDIGRSSGGATPAQVAEQLMNAIAAKASEVASTQLAGQLKDQISGAVKTGKPADAVNQLKGLLGE